MNANFIARTVIFVSVRACVFAQALTLSFLSIGCTMQNHIFFSAVSCVVLAWFQINLFKFWIVACVANSK